MDEANANESATSGTLVSAPKSKKPLYKRWWFIVLAVIVALFILAAATSKKPTTPNSNKTASHTTTSGASSSAKSTTTTAPATTTTGAPSGLNQTVRDGDFAFVVQSITCGAAANAQVESGVFGETIPAGAQECLVAMTVANDKSTAQTYFASNQYAYDAAGRQFSADTNAFLILSNGNDATQLNPGISISVVVPFQIPSTDSIVKLELHDSVLSGGVDVNVG